jgi:hypothetical protein
MSDFAAAVEGRGALAAIVCPPLFRSGQLVSRREGALFVSAFLVYLGSLPFRRA